MLEQLETREVPASYTAGSVADLVADINVANLAGGANTITLTAGSTFTLTQANDPMGYDGLPAIAANDNLTIIGKGATIERNPVTSTSGFRLFDVASGAALALANLTLQGGVTGEGGGIYNQGALTLNGVTVQNDSAAEGGGIYSGGALTLTDCTIQNNRAIGSTNYYPYVALPGGDGLGGGIYIAGGTASLTNVSLSANTAQGGDGNSGYYSMPDERGRGSVYVSSPQSGGNGLGGGIYVASGSVTVRLSSLTDSIATGGSAGGPTTGGHSKVSNGVGEGGGLYIAKGAKAWLDSFTQAHVTNDNASTSNADIFGNITTIT